MSNIPLIFSFGDPGSINPEIFVKSLNIFEKKIFNVIVVGSLNSLKNFKEIEKQKRKIEISEFFLNIEYKSIFSKLTLLENFIDEAANQILNKFSRFVNDNDKIGKSNILFFDPLPDLNFSVGKIDIKNGFLSYLYLEVCCRIIELLNFKAYLITLPVNKKSVSLFEKRFKGHTDFLIERFKVKNARMLMHSNEVSVMMETNHLPILKLAKYLNKQHFFKTLQLAADAIRRLNLEPFIYVLGLNPHMSDSSLIGNDEQKWIIPTIQKFSNFISKDKKEDSIEIEGPFSSDSIFIENNLFKKRHGIFIAWYHDQGLIPYKILSKNKGANITIGLPFIRISPDHGTGFDIVGKDKADPSSLSFCINTIYSLEGK